VSSAKEHTARNVAALLGDFILFSIGFAFYDPMVVVPAFVQEFSGSRLLVGGLSALRVLMIWAASLLHVAPRKKPVLIWSSFIGRLPILILALATLLWVDTHPVLVFALLAVATAVFFTSEGLNGVSWPTLVGRVVPEGIRGRFFGAGQLLSSVGAALAGLVVNRLLRWGGVDVSTRWAVLFAIGFVGLMASVLSMLFIRERAESAPYTKVDVGRSLRLMAGYLRVDADLRRLVMANLVLGLAGSVFPFIVGRASQVVPGVEARLGSFVTVQSVGGAAAALLGGYLIDRLGSWAAIRMAAFVEALGILAVTVAPLTAAPLTFYLVAYFLLGYVTASLWWSISAYLLELAPEDERPMYLATSGILGALGALNPVIAGVLFETLAPEHVFGGAVVLALVGLALAWMLRKQRQGAAPAEGIATGVIQG